MTRSNHYIQRTYDKIHFRCIHIEQEITLKRSVNRAIDNDIT